MDALCKTVLLQNPPGAILLRGYLRPASLHAISSVHKHLHHLRRLFRPEVNVQEHGKCCRAPERVCGPFLPNQDRIFPIAGLNLDLHVGNLLEVYIIKILVTTGGLQKETFALKNLVVAGTGILLETDLC